MIEEKYLLSTDNIRDVFKRVLELKAEGKKLILVESKQNSSRNGLIVLTFNGDLKANE
jgi:hypothetical protein